ncbi:hypothetical protein NMY22_g9788 [Coprinellus aureogranulatus]|nr:hypothetical protein NMY22_g9788 [Coprinellus aureogranulatus]
MAIASVHPSSPFSRELKCNNPLPQSEAELLDSLLKAQNSELSTLDSEIQQLQQALDTCRARQRKLGDAVQAHKSLLSPIRRLPEELLQQIFLLCRTAHRMPLLSQDEAPLLLTRICRDWRNLALSTPALWDSIHIPIPYNFAEEQIQFHLRRAERWLDMAKQSPLSISLYSGCGKSTPDEGPLEAFLRRVVIDRAPRIRHLQLELEEELVSFIGSAIPVDSWVMLEKVALRGIEWGTDIPGLSVWEASKLRSVVWESVKADVFCLELNWKELEEIKISEDGRDGTNWDEEWDAFSASQAHALIFDSPKLRRLKININSDAAQFWLNGCPHHHKVTWATPLVLPHLTTLELLDVYLDPASSPVTFLRGLQLPALENLTYKLLSRAGYPVRPDSPLAPLPHGEAHPLVSFLNLQKGPIRMKTFKVSHPWTMSQADFVDCLRKMPMLERLWVADRRRIFESSLKADPMSDVSPNAALLRLLQPPVLDPSQALCPRLTDLRFDRMEECEFDDVESFVRDRLHLANAFPLLHSILPAIHTSQAISSSSPKEAFGSLPASRSGVSRLRRIYIGLTKPTPDFVPRDYGPNRAGPACALEDDLWELGVEARIMLLPLEYEEEIRKYTKEKYKPYEGLPFGCRSSSYYEPEWPWH